MQHTETHKTRKNKINDSLILLAFLYAVIAKYETFMYNLSRPGGILAGVWRATNQKFI